MQAAPPSVFSERIWSHPRIRASLRRLILNAVCLEWKRKGGPSQHWQRGPNLSPLLLFLPYPRRHPDSCTIKSCPSTCETLSGTPCLRGSQWCGLLYIPSTFSCFSDRKGFHQGLQRECDSHRNPTRHLTPGGREGRVAVVENGEVIRMSILSSWAGALGVKGARSQLEHPSRCWTLTRAAATGTTHPPGASCAWPRSGHTSECPSAKCFPEAPPRS